MTTGYDIVGDIHGHYDHLVAMLPKLGYAKRDGVWRHPGQEMLFVGHLIDRGPKQPDVLDTVRREEERRKRRRIGPVERRRRTNSFSYLFGVAVHLRRKFSQ